MRGSDRTSGSLFSYVDLDARVAQSHPLRTMRDLVNASLAAMDASFEALYKAEGRPSIPPERLLRATLLQLLYSIRSERQLVERLEFDLLFRWFVGMGIDDEVFDASSFSKNRDVDDRDRARVSGLLAGAAARQKIVERRAFLDRWHDVESLRLDEEFSGEGWFGRAAVFGPQRRA